VYMKRLEDDGVMSNKKFQYNRDVTLCFTLKHS
jgi:hypothetical protein